MLETFEFIKLLRFAVICSNVNLNLQKKNTNTAYKNKSCLGHRILPSSKLAVYFFVDQSHRLLKIYCHKSSKLNRKQWKALCEIRLVETKNHVSTNSNQYCKKLRNGLREVKGEIMFVL